MVCIPCVIAPVVLLLWRYLVQPLLIKFWNFRHKIKNEDEKQSEGLPQLVKECNDGGCTLSWSKSQKSTKVD